MNEERGWRAGAALSSKRRSPRTPFLIGMSEHHIHLLADCAMRSRFEAGHLIFREGETANRFYLIERGKVALESSTLGEPVRIEEIAMATCWVGRGFSRLTPGISPLGH